MSHIFKAGDRVKIIEDCSGSYAGDITTIVSDGGVLRALRLEEHDEDDGDYGCSCQHNWILHEKITKKRYIINKLYGDY